ncbi:MAG: glycosyl transferase group 1 [uncultured bacterium]|nr:MAG: glycosyl transferase group 1 [uncultured bacterium]
MVKPIMAILTESIRRDNHLPLKNFDKIKIVHFYQSAPYNDMTKDELTSCIRYNNVFDLYSKLKELKPNIIQGAEPYGSKKMFLLSITAYLISKRLKIPLIFPFWENVSPKTKFNLIQRLIVNWFLKLYVRQSTLVIYLNEGARINLINAGANNDKITKFLWGTWGVDVGLFRPNSKFKIQNSKLKTILFGGRLDYEKGITYLLPAYLEVRKKIKNVKLVLIGGGKLIDWAKEFVTKHHLENEVTFTGLIKTKNLPNYFNEADVFTCPAVSTNWWQEQVGMINLQAMSSGVPIVSTISGAISEYVPNNLVGKLVKEKDSNKLAQALLSILSDDKLRLKMSILAREFAIKNYDDKKNITKAQNIIMEILDDNKTIK